MRTLIVTMLLLGTMATKAQTGLTATDINYRQQQSLLNHIQLQDSLPQKKWSVSKYIGLGTSFAFYNGGSATVFSVPVGIQLNRRLTNNWYAFAGIAAAPSYINFNHAFVAAPNNKFGQSTSFFTPNRYDVFSRAELGLMYTSDQKTFSISGSIGVERGANPLMPYGGPLGTVRPVGRFN